MRQKQDCSQKPGTLMAGFPLVSVMSGLQSLFRRSACDRSWLSREGAGTPIRDGGSLLLACGSRRGLGRSREETARLREPAGIWWGLFFLHAVCRDEGMNKRMRKFIPLQSWPSAGPAGHCVLRGDAFCASVRINSLLSVLPGPFDHFSGSDLSSSQYHLSGLLQEMGQCWPER